MKFNTIKTAVFPLLLLSSTLEAQELKFNGFASAGGGTFFGDLEEDQFVEGGYTNELETSEFIKFALQAKAKLNDRTTVVGQFLSRGADGYDVSTEWAYISYALTRETEIRFGRIRTPLFMYSDYLDVGYAYPWIRPPIDLYRLPFSTIEGVDIISTGTFGDWDGSFQAYYGNLEEDTTVNGQEISLNLTNYAGFNYSLSNDWLTTRVSYNRTDYTNVIPEAEVLFAALDEFGLNAVTQLLRLEDDSSSFYGAGFTVDFRNILMSGEFTVMDIGEQSLLSNDTAWYLMLGYRISDVTFHVTYSYQESDVDNEAIDTLFPGNPAFEPLRQGVYDAITQEDDSSLTLGIRWDYSSSSSFKIEFSSIEQRNEGENGLEGNTVSFSVDTVF